MWIWLRIKWFPVVPGLAALPLMFEQGGKPSIAKEIFSTLPDYVIHVLHTRIHMKSVGVGDVSLISVLWIQKQSCCSPHSVWLETFLSCCFAPIHRNHLFPRKIQYFLRPPAVREPTVFWALSLQRAIKFWAENSLFPLETFSFQPERLPGICFRLLCNTCCWWQCRSFSALWEERWLTKKGQLYRRNLNNLNALPWLKKNNKNIIASYNII